MEKDNAKSNHLKKADDGRLKTQRINQLVKDMQFIYKETTIHLMFQDVVAFGRIDKPKYVGAKRNKTICIVFLYQGIQICIWCCRAN